MADGAWWEEICQPASSHDRLSDLPLTQWFQKFLPYFGSSTLVVS